MFELAWVGISLAMMAGSYGTVRYAQMPDEAPSTPEPVDAGNTPEPGFEPTTPLAVAGGLAEENTLVPTSPGGSRRWVALLSATAPLAAVGLYAHHRRFVKYHAYKGLPANTSFGSWIRAEVPGIGMLGWWHLVGFRKDGLRTPPNAVGRPVLCVHGYAQNATNFVGLRRVLEAAGRPTAAVSLWHRIAPIDWYVHRLALEVEKMAEAHPEGIDVVAHSMGGVVLRVVLERRPDLRARVHTVVTLGSPHRGTASLRGIPFVPELVALRRRSALLRDLPQLPELLPHARIVTIAGDTDTVVYPVETSLVPGAEAVVLPGIGHAGLLTSPVSWDAVRRALA